MSITFREKVPRSHNNLILSIPNLSHQNLILKSIDFMTDEWHFEAVLKTASTDLIKMTTTYFKHFQSLDLSGLTYKIEEGDKLDLCIKPKQAPRDIDLMICYTYTKSEGSIYYQNSERVMDIGTDSTVLVDITQSMRPTHLYIQSDEQISSLVLKPKFIDQEEETTSYTFDVNDDNFDLDFNQEELSNVLPLLRFYTLDIKLKEGNNMDAQVHYLARGFKQ